MTENRKRMDRRCFLMKSASFLAGSFIGFNSLSKAFACEKSKTRSVSQPRISLIIDDIGNSFTRTRRFLDLGIPITFAILPKLSKTRDLATEIHDQEHEIMLHQPMEPYNSNLNPGPGALYVGYEAIRIVRIMEENLSDVPFAIGVNNHMGSKFTSCQKEIKEALRVVKERDLFFVDSLTSSRSMAYKTAKRLRLATAYRNIFLDNDPSESVILSQLFKLKRYAYAYGHAIGIGHPYIETAKAISQFLKTFGKSDLCLVHISKLLHQY
jgi:polysaccharide deacetylase 2 family uncharacterized protein YibQ